jgi:uncharacterized membrane protein YkoI
MMFAALAGLSLGLALSPYLAQAKPVDTATPVIIAQNGGSISLDEAARRVAKRTGGRVLAAQTVQRGGQTYYEIRVLVDPGRVRVFRVNARTGDIR